MKDKELLRARLYGLFAVAAAAYTGVMATILGCWWRYRVTPLHPEDSLVAALAGVGWMAVGLVGMMSNKKVAAAAPEGGTDDAQSSRHTSSTP